jgi:serine phosphatase RsbU (regulator of sigma subunit)
VKTDNLYYQGFSELTAFIAKQDYKSAARRGAAIFVQVFCGIPEESYIENLLWELSYLLPAESQIIGLTTAGEIMNGKVSFNQTVLSFTVFEETKVRTLFLEKQDLDAFDTGRYIVNQIVTEKTKGMLVFAEAVQNDAYRLLKGIESLRPDLPVFGGAPGDNLQFKAQYCFTQAGITKTGVVAAAFDSDTLIITNKYHLDWIPIGKEFTVTDADGKLLKKVENFTAYELYARYLGKEIADAALKGAADVFPLMLKKEGTLIGRVPVQVNDDGSMVMFGPLEVGDKVQFSYGHVETLLSQTDHIIAETQELPVESIFVYSCVGRRNFMQDSIETEILPLQTIAPTTGLFTYGEFFHANCSNELMNLTMTLAIMSESKNSLIPAHSQTISSRAHTTGRHITIMKTLTHLVTVVTGELQESLAQLAEFNEELSATNDELRAVNDQLDQTIKEVNQKNEIIEARNQDIMDSILYARRIQRAILPEEQKFKASFSDYFIYYRPKDIVSGDFYWLVEEPGRVAIAVVDCTGHGVPGAFMSLMGYNTLNRVFQEMKEWDPAYALERLDSIVRKDLKQDSGGTNDGMELMLCIVNQKEQAISIASANRPALLVKDNEIIEIKGDKKPIGGSLSPHKPFSLQRFPIKKGMRLYMFSDGITDQFGGDSRRKFTPKRLKELVLEIQPLTMEKQYSLFEQRMNQWKGNIEQLDDMILIALEW